MKRKIKKPTIDWIKFDSWEESIIYQHLKKWTLWDFTGIPVLNKYKLLDARPKWIQLFKWFKAWEYTQRARSYKWDFTCLDDNGVEIHLEYKSCWSERKPDYRLRRFLVLLNWKLNFTELIKIRKWQYELRRYF